MPTLAELQNLDAGNTETGMVAQLRVLDDPTKVAYPTVASPSGSVWPEVKAYGGDIVRGALGIGTALAKAPTLLGVADTETPSIYDPASTRDQELLAALPQHNLPEEQRAIPAKIISGVVSTIPFLVMGPVGGPTVIGTQGLDAYEKARAAGLSPISAASHGILGGLTALAMLKAGIGKTATATLGRAAIAGPGLAIGGPILHKGLAELQATSTGTPWDDFRKDPGNPDAAQRYADSIGVKEIFDPTSIGVATALTFGFGIPAHRAASRQANIVVENLRVAKAKGEDVTDPVNFERTRKMAEEVTKGRTQEALYKKVMEGQDIDATKMPGELRSSPTDTSVEALLNDLELVSGTPAKTVSAVEVQKKPTKRGKKAKPAEPQNNVETPPESTGIVPETGEKPMGMQQAVPEMLATQTANLKPTSPEMQAPAVPKVGDADVITDTAELHGYFGDTLESGDGPLKLPEPGLYINDVFLKEGVAKGKGFGQELYLKALDQYGTLYSAFPLSRDAARAQDRLVEKGLADVKSIEVDGVPFRKLTKPTPIENVQESHVKVEEPSVAAKHYQDTEGNVSLTPHDSPYNLEISGPEGSAPTAENVRRIVVDPDTWAAENMVSRLREDVTRLKELYPKAKISIVDTRGDAPVEIDSFNKMGNNALAKVKKAFGATEDVNPRVKRGNVSVEEKVARILVKQKGGLEAIGEANPELAKRIIEDLGLKRRSVEETTPGVEGKPEFKIQQDVWYKGTKGDESITSRDRTKIERELPNAVIEKGKLDSNHQFTADVTEAPKVVSASEQTALTDLASILSSERGSLGEMFGRVIPGRKKLVADPKEVVEQYDAKTNLKGKLSILKSEANAEGKTLREKLVEQGVGEEQANKMLRILHEDTGFSAAQTGHMLRKALGLSNEDYTALKLSLTGVESMTKMPLEAQDKVLNALQQLHFAANGNEYTPISRARKNAYKQDATSTAIMEPNLILDVPRRQVRSFVDTFMSSAETVLRRTPAGAEFARLLRVREQNAEIRTGILEADFKAIIAGLSKEQINEAGAVYRGEVTSANEQINKAAEFIGRSFKAYAQEMEAQGYKILNPLTGKRELFTAETSPKRLASELRKELELSRKQFDLLAKQLTGVESKKYLTDEHYAQVAARLKEVYKLKTGEQYEPKAYWPKEYKIEDIANPTQLRDRILANIQKDYGISKAEAEVRLNRITDRMKKGPGLFGHLEIESLANLPDFNKNVMEVLPEYWYKAARRLEFTAEFGQDSKGLDRHLAAIQAEAGPEAVKVGAATARRLFGGADYVDPYTRGLINSITTAETITKLGLAVMNNSMQTANVYVQTDLRTMLNTGKRILKGISDKQTRTELNDFVARTHVLHDTFFSVYSDYMRDPTTMVKWLNTNVKGAEKVLTEPNMAGNFLKYTGFTHVEAFNRLFSALAGREFANEQVTALRNAPVGSRAEKLAEIRLAKLGLDPVELRGRDLTDGDLYRAGNSMAELTQFKNNALTLPKVLGDSPWLRLVTLFHTFGYHQTKMLKNLWTTDPGRIMPSLLTIAATGGLITLAKDFVRGNDREWGEDVKKDITALLGNGIGFGMAMDAVEGMLHSKAGLANFITGPAVGDIGELTFNAGKAIEGNLEPLGRQLLRSVPVVGPTLNNLTK